jgi:hypothetical protein
MWQKRQFKILRQNNTVLRVRLFMVSGSCHLRLQGQSLLPSKIRALRNVLNHPPSDTASHPRQYRCENLKFRYLIFIFIHWGFSWPLPGTRNQDFVGNTAAYFRQREWVVTLALQLLCSFHLDTSERLLCFFRLLHARTVEQTFGFILWKDTIHWSCSLYYRQAGSQEEHTKWGSRGFDVSFTKNSKYK